VADDRGVLYVDPVCPHCRTRFDPLPKRGRKCPACGQPVVYARGDDDLVRLRRPDDPEDKDAAWARDQAARDALFQNRNGEPLRALNRERLATYAALRIRVRVVNADLNSVVIGGADQIGPGASSCDRCKSLVGVVYDALEAPLLPLSGCRSRPNGICVCRYELFPTA